MSDELKVIDGGQTAPNAVLKTLTMTGFKSFVHRTHLEFAPGITAIIGPNGSGKSNVADAIRWALGENNARILRAKKNEELSAGRIRGTLHPQENQIAHAETPSRAYLGDVGTRNRRRHFSIEPDQRPATLVRVAVDTVRADRARDLGR